MKAQLLRWALIYVGSRGFDLGWRGRAWSADIVPHKFQERDEPVYRRSRRLSKQGNLCYYTVR